MKRPTVRAVESDEVVDLDAWVRLYVAALLALHAPDVAAAAEGRIVAGGSDTPTPRTAERP